VTLDASNRARRRCVRLRWRRGGRPATPAGPRPGEREALCRLRPDRRLQRVV